MTTANLASASDFGSGSTDGDSRPDSLGLPPRRRRASRFAAFLAILSLLAGWQALGASADSADDLRGDIPTGDDIRAELTEIADDRAQALGSLTSAEAQLADVLHQRDDLDDIQRRLAAEIEAATHNLRRLAVQTFITGGDTGTLEYLAAVEEASDFSWRQHLVRSHAGSSQIAIEHLDSLRAQADDEVLDSITRAEDLRIEMTVLDVELSLLQSRERALQADLPLAEAWDRAAIAITEGQWGIAPAAKWERLRFCESTHNYQAISPSGLYRGAYQFDFPTWQTVGGTGDPAAAPAEEQDARARELYARRGPQPWPVCGRHLE